MYLVSILRPFRFAFALLVLVAVGWQLSIHVRLGYSVVNFFSYFTNLSNLVAAGVFFATALQRNDAQRHPLLDRCRYISAVNMAVVGIVFAGLLRHVDLGALLPWINTLLHYVMPVVVVLDWLLDPAAKAPAWRRFATVLIVPALYLAYVMLRGAYVGWYPYPFLNPAATEGYAGVTIYAIGIALTFLLVGAVLHVLGGMRRKRP